jgi:hypothetical protein
MRVTTRKLINTNGNTEGIFPSVNFRGILPTNIFPRYIPRELPWEKKLKQSKKKWWHVIFTHEITDGINSVSNSVGKFVGKNVNTIHHVNYKGNHRRNCPSVFFRELQNCSLFNCTVNCCSFGQNHRRIEKSSMLFGGFLKKFN